MAFFSSHKRRKMADFVEFNKECCLCLQTFTDPRVLPCLHTFCLKCLEKIGAAIPNDWMLCPVCGSTFTVPEEGAIGLPKNIFADKLTKLIKSTSKFNSADNPSCDVCAKVNFGDVSVAEKYCINCEEKLCVTCDTKHRTEKEHLIVELSCQKKTKRMEKEEEKDKEEEAEKEDEEKEKKEEEKEKEFRCRVHKEETLKLFCTFCKKVICEVCLNEAHLSHSCSDLTDIGKLVCKLAEKEYNIAGTMQIEFEERRETLHREQMTFLQKVKKMETEILQRCEEIKELVIKETKALLHELAVLKSEMLEEIEMEYRRVDKHLFTLEKFKEYCAWIKNKGALSYTGEAGCVLSDTADQLRTNQKCRIENKIFPIQFEFQKIDIGECVMRIRNAFGKVNVIYPYKLDQPVTIDTNSRTVHGMASLHDKLYLLSDSVLIHRAEMPYDRVGEIKIRDINSPASIVSCNQTSRLYIYDKGSACIWKVSVPDHQVTRWLNKVKEPCALTWLGKVHVNVPCALSVTSKGEVLILSQITGATQPVSVEIYDQNAILTERIELPKEIQSLKRICKMSSGDYIGLGDEKMFKFRADGSIVCQSDITANSGTGDCVRCMEETRHCGFPNSSTSLDSLGFAVSLLSSDLGFHSRLLIGEMLISVCFIKSTKRLAVLEHEQANSRFTVMGERRFVTVYNVC